KRKFKKHHIREKKPRAHRSLRFEETEASVSYTGAPQQLSTSCTSAEEYVKQLTRPQLEKSLLTIADYDLRKIKATTAVAGSGADPSAHHQPQPHAFCACKHCVDMPTPLEQLCCKKTPRLCVTQLEDFQTICLNRSILSVALCYREDLLCLPEVRANDAIRHAGYRQFVYWRM
ncbi:PREDICTED: P2X purinoceptor 7-like, partial [Priapulus caudatus]|uniref:P2X purinoceptor 7-like n=1 Tax=Priapulus caudatus TaxID=37621 RepID=A0ABM1F4K0_PRICU